MSVKALGKENVLSVAMPCCSNKVDYEDAKLVSDTFGVELMTIDLTSTYNQIEKAIEEVQKLNTETKINIKPRLRMTTLYAIAQTMRLSRNGNRKPLRINGPATQQNGAIAPPI